VVPLTADFLDNDLTLVFMAARIGLEHGWSHIYSADLQRQVFHELRPQAMFDNGGWWYLNTPPFAWLVAPLVPLGAEAAVATWLAISLASLVATWWIAAPGTGRMRALWLLGAFAWYPVLYALSLVQPDFLIVLLVALAWKLSQAGRPYLAGAVLGLTAIKPQLTLLLPLLLLTSGQWRIAIAWAAVAGGLGVLSLISLGPNGLSDYRSLISQAQGIANNRYFTLAYVLGPGALAYIASAVVTVVAAVAAYLNRQATGARIFALGLVATALAATYWHLQDFTMLVLAAWLFWRDSPPAWQRWALLLVVVGGELAWGLTPLPVLLGVAIWFGELAVPAKVSRVAA